MRAWISGRRKAEARPEAPAEDALVRRARDGDADAFGELVRLHQDRVYRLALRMVGPHDAEDVAQQALIKAWQGLPRFQGDAGFGTWLYRIAINACMDELRRAARLRPLPLDEASTLAGNGEVSDVLAEAAETEARRAALAWALAQAPSEDRLILHLRTGEGKSYAEISALLGIPVRTVGTRLFRARARLHALISRRLQESGDGVH